MGLGAHFSAKNFVRIHLKSLFFLAGGAARTPAGASPGPRRDAVPDPGWGSEPQTPKFTLCKWSCEQGASPLHRPRGSALLGTQSHQGSSHDGDVPHDVHGTDQPNPCGEGHPEGEIFEVILDPQEGEFHFDTYMHRPYSTASQAPATFHTTRKKGFKAHERDLSVWYFPDKSLPHNPTATNLFKMQLYGDVLMVQQSREQSFIPRERYVSFTKQCYDEHFAKKRRRSQSDTPSLTPTAYAELKQTMQNSLNEFEHNVSKDAVKPREVVMAYSVITGNHVKQSTASKIAKSLKGRGYTIPKKTSSIGVTPPPSTLDEIKEVLDDVVVAVVDRQGGQGQEWTRG